ncbi:zinc-ribbon domain-containing protein [Flavonifractor sp. An4]|uniref:zinc-ribbon domain-containing protein n=1 Tax=Flavonifractor sp. An4 TaxID=1965634 RepID=UPI000B36ED29|nr:zinc-ribbon domain-containing protein [Flavonifractor sp. An4]OUO17039.1 hypothetical protein B5F94_04725 [Flavonifractor sp. An4]
MYCEHCGTQIPDGSIFCVACGKKQSGGVVTEEPRQDMTPPQEPETVVPQAEPENTPSNDEFDWSTFNPVPEEPVEQVKAEPEPVQQEPQSPWQATSAPQQEAQSPWQASAPQQEAQSPWQASAPQQETQSPWQASASQQEPQQNSWQGSQQNAQSGGWQQSGWQSSTQQSAPGWQQNSWQNGAQQSAPGWQQQNNWQQSGWQNNQQPGGWQSAPQQGYQGGWQSAPQQSAYNSPYEERRQPVYHNGRIDYGCPMNWYKFQIYFSMIPTALFYLIIGIVLLGIAGSISGTGMSFGLGLEYYYYGEFPSLLCNPAGIIMLATPLFVDSLALIGLIAAIFGVLMLVAWVKMIRLQSGGWVLYLILNCLPIMFLATNLIIISSRLNNYHVPSNYILEAMAIPLIVLAVNVLILILQIVYFKKRSYLFVNR